MIISEFEKKIEDRNDFRLSIPFGMDIFSFKTKIYFSDQKNEILCFSNLLKNLKLGEKKIFIWTKTIPELNATRTMLFKKAWFYKNLEWLNREKTKCRLIQNNKETFFSIISEIESSKFPNCVQYSKNNDTNFLLFMPKENNMLTCIDLFLTDNFDKKEDCFNFLFNKKIIFAKFYYDFNDKINFDVYGKKEFLEEILN